MHYQTCTRIASGVLHHFHEQGVHEFQAGQTVFKVGVHFPRLPQSSTHLSNIPDTRFYSFQVAEMREDVPLEAHIRVYAIRHVNHAVRTIYYQTSPMRLLHPDGTSTEHHTPIS
jgi:hypothetical protein